MNLIVERAHVWASSMEDRPGGLAQLLRPLRNAGADLDCIIARRSPEAPGKAVVFVSPLRGDKEVAAAADAGFNVASSIHSVRVQGQNKPGLAADLAEKLGKAGINMRGFSATELGTRFVMYIGLDSETDADKVVEVLRKDWHYEVPEWQLSAA